MNYKLPIWLKNIESALRFDSVFVIHGSEVKDDVVLPKDLECCGSEVSFSELDFMSFRDSLKHILKLNGFNALISYDINNGFIVESLDEGLSPNSVKAQLSKALKVNFDAAVADQDGFFHGVPELIMGLSDEGIYDNQLNYAVMIDCFSETDPADHIASTHPNIELAMLASYQLAKNKITPFIQSFMDKEVAVKHPVFWIVRDTSILPSYLLSGIGIRQVSVSSPDLDCRNLAMGVACYPYISDYSDSADQRSIWDPLFAKAAKAFSGLSVMTIEEITQKIMADTEPESEPEHTINRIVNTAKEYRVGLTENPWASKTVMDRIENGVSILSETVKGQNHAILKSVDVLNTATLGINSIDSKDGSTAPRGCLFFAGPTGVGKTELAKSIAKLVFGSEDDMIRFDMSEFAEAHNAARLVGSPPGYVGNEQGGELTNKVKAKPFSLILFDEIEKADSSIFDKFLQVLSDGRLTDGRGDTVYFTETIIVFTSNRGVAEMQEWAKQNPDSTDEEYRAEFKRHIEDYFYTINRPEVFGRIDEDNVIIFNALDKGIAAQIAELGIQSIKENIYNQQHITIELTECAQTRIIDLVSGEDTLRYGGRGVKNALRKVLIKPLAKSLMKTQQTGRNSIRILDVRQANNLIELIYENPDS